MLSVADMFNLAATSTGVELYRKGKYRGMLLVTQCEVEQPIDMVMQCGKQGYVAAYPPRKLQISTSLPAYWPSTSTFPPRVHQLPNPTYPSHPPSNISLRESKIPTNYQASYQPLANAAQALGAAHPRGRSVSSPEGMGKRTPSSSLHEQVLRKVSQGAAKVGLGSIGDSLEKLGQSTTLGSFGSLVHKATRSKKGWSLGDQLDRLSKK